jgi:acetyl-CoA acyltransferase 1
MLSHVLRAAYTQPGLDPALIEDVAVGTVLQAGSGAGTSRMAALHAGIPYTTSLNTVNRQCSSGLSTVNQIANQIKAGQIDIGIGSFVSCLIMWFVFNCFFPGAGVESMTMGYGPTAYSVEIDSLSVPSEG